MVKKSVSCTFLLIFGFLCFYTSNLNGINAEEICSWMADGSQVCKDESDESYHNVWTEELDEDVPVAGNMGNVDTENTKDINELELELFVLFASQLKDWDPEDGLSKFNPEVIVLSILNAFNAFDENDDGNLEYTEIEKILSERSTQENLSSIRKKLDEYPESKISIFDCLKMFHRFNNGKETIALLSPFEKMRYMTPTTAKKIIQGSVQMFIDSDENHDGKLNKDEFSFGMNRAQEKRKEMGGHIVEATSEQLDALFTLVDKDTDEYLTYTEFQGTMPDKPRTFGESIDKMFEDADVNTDNGLSEVEFTSYMKEKSIRENHKAVPSEKELSDVFQKLDVNEDDMLSRNELMKMFEEVKKVHEQRIVEAFNSFDKNGDGSLTLDELKEISEGVEKNTGQEIDVNVFMTMLDQDKDQKVSLDEMTVMLTKLMK